jgi:hypothetical protein
MVTCAYGFTGGQQTFAVPAGVSSLNITAIGAGGAGSDLAVGNSDATTVTLTSGATSGGRGAVVSASVPVTPSSTLYVLVGGEPTTTPNVPQAGCYEMVSCVGGFNGGGSGETTDGGGGGASDVRTVSSCLPGCSTDLASSLDSRLLVAAGGGGGGEGEVCPDSSIVLGGSGADAGGVGFAGAVCDDEPGTTTTGGEPGTQSSGGAGGVTTNPNNPPYTMDPGPSGAQGAGGGVGVEDETGGGGGGLYGGGAGGPSGYDPNGNDYGTNGASGGGGGSSLDPSGAPLSLSSSPASVTISYSTAPTGSTAPVFSADAPPATATVGSAYSYTFRAFGQPAPSFTVASGALPAGLKLDASTGTLSGTPTSAGSSTFTVKATNGVGPDAVSGALKITVAPAATASVGRPTVSGTTAGAAASCVGGAGASCTITLTLSLVETLQGSNVIAVTASKNHPKTRKRTVVVGTSTVKLAAGQHKIIHVALNGAGKRLLAERHKLPVKLTASQHDRSSHTATITFKEPAKKRKHH